MTDVIIIGGGLSGMFAARELAKSGATVTLIERGEVGKEASWAGGGILSPLYPWRYPDAVNRLALASQAMYPVLARELADATGVDSEWTESGMLVLDPPDGAEAESWLSSNKQEFQKVDAQTCGDLEPSLKAGSDALWLPRVAQIRNPFLVRALVSELSARVSVRLNEPVVRILADGDRVTGVQTALAIHHADAVLVASGAWSAQLLHEVAEVKNIFPVRGQMIMYRAHPDLMRRIVLSRNRYLIPRRDGRIIVGSTVEYAGFEKASTAEARDLLARFALETVPALADFPIEKQWSGLRPGSPRGIPMISEHPRLRGLFVNAGHFRNGVVMGPAAARLVVDLILRRPTIFDPTPYKI